MPSGAVALNFIHTSAFYLVNAEKVSTPVLTRDGIIGCRGFNVSCFRWKGLLYLDATFNRIGLVHLELWIFLLALLRNLVMQSFHSLAGAF